MQTDKNEKLNETFDKILKKSKKTSTKKTETCFDKELVETVNKKIMLEDGRQLLLN